MFSDFGMCAEVHFAKLDDMLQLICDCLKGEMAVAIRAKKMDVFIDHLCGGQNAQIACEREANAVSNSAINVAARNVAGVGEGTAQISSVGDVSALSSAAVVVQQGDDTFAVTVNAIRGACSEVMELAVQLRDCKVAYVDYANTKLEMEAKLNEQAFEHAKAMRAAEAKALEDLAKARREAEASAHAQSLEHAKEKSEAEAKALEVVANAKSEAETQSLEHAKAMMELNAKAVELEKLKAEIDERNKASTANHEATLLKIRLEHEAGLAKLREDEADKNLERDAKRAKLSNSTAAKRNDVPVAGLRRSTRVRRTRY